MSHKLKNTVSKLSLNSGTDDKVEIGSSQELLKLLECPICTNPQVAPIYNCERGHSVCNSCLTKLKKCPICKSSFNKSRNYLAESIADTCIVKCLYEEFGCNVNVAVKDRESHISKCGFRPIECQCSRQRQRECCKSLIPIDQYTTHLKEIHHVKEIELGEITVKKVQKLKKGVTEQTWRPYHFVVTDKTFMRMAVLKNGILYLWIVMVSPTPEESQEYSCTITIQSSNKEMEFSYKLPVHHFREESTDKVIKKATCASLPYSSLKPFCYSVESEDIDYKYWNISLSVNKM